MGQQYLHVLCEAYALLVNTRQIEEIVGETEGFYGQTSLSWRQQELTVLDLSQLLLNKASTQRQDCLILKLSQEHSADDYVAIAVGRVTTVEEIDEQAFKSIPQLAFPYHDYFDKVYIHPTTKQCIYRLKDSALLEFTL